MTAAAVTVCGAWLLLGSAGAGAALRASASTIQVGAIADEQTPCEEAGTGQIGPDTLRAWQSYVNKHGGITGHPVQLTILNSKCDPGVSLSDANQLVSQHVIAVIDATSEDSSIAAPLDAAKIPVLCGAPSANDLYCSTDANFFPSGATELATVYGTVFASHKAGAKTFGFLYCTGVRDVPASSSVLRSADKRGRDGVCVGRGERNCAEFTWRSVSSCRVLTLMRYS